jgi:hypothetical protein
VLWLGRAFGRCVSYIIAGWGCAKTKAPGSLVPQGELKPGRHKGKNKSEGEAKGKKRSETRPLQWAGLMRIIGVLRDLEGVWLASD